MVGAARALHAPRPQRDDEDAPVTGARSSKKDFATGALLVMDMELAALRGLPRVAPLPPPPAHGDRARGRRRQMFAAVADRAARGHRGPGTATRSRRGVHRARPEALRGGRRTRQPEGWKMFPDRASCDSSTGPTRRAGPPPRSRRRHRPAGGAGTSSRWGWGPRCSTHAPSTQRSAPRRGLGRRQILPTFRLLKLRGGRARRKVDATSSFRRAPKMATNPTRGPDPAAPTRRLRAHTAAIVAQRLWVIALFLALVGVTVFVEPLNHPERRETVWLVYAAEAVMSALRPRRSAASGCTVRRRPRGHVGRLVPACFVLLGGRRERRRARRHRAIVPADQPPRAPPGAGARSAVWRSPWAASLLAPRRAHGAYSYAILATVAGALVGRRRALRTAIASRSRIGGGASRRKARSPRRARRGAGRDRRASPRRRDPRGQRRPARHAQSVGSVGVSAATGPSCSWDEAQRDAEAGAAPAPARRSSRDPARGDRTTGAPWCALRPA